MKKVLMTGGSGFIGRHIIPHLLKRQFEIHVVTTSEAFQWPGVKVYQTNLLDTNTHQQLINAIRPTHLLHSAWYTQNKKFWEAIENVHWLKATLTLAQTFFDGGGERILALGTCAEYDWTYGLCSEGVTPELPSTLYGKVKKSTYDCLKALADNQGKSFCWARVFFPYGPFEAKSRLIPYVITQLLNNEAANCTHGHQIRDFLYVNDMANALAVALDSALTGVVNIGSGRPITIREVVMCVAEMIGKIELVNFGAIPEPTHSPRMILANNDRLKNELGWSPALTLDQGLSNTIAWWRQIESTNSMIREASK